ncbi:hybrid sensory kinase in two-component regulatory system with RcsB and YojN [compost metagenome]
MTANVLKEERERCLSAGMADFMAKPVKGLLIRQLLDSTGKEESEASSNYGESSA